MKLTETHFEITLLISDEPFNLGFLQTNLRYPPRVSPILKIIYTKHQIIRKQILHAYTKSQYFYVGLTH